LGHAGTAGYVAAAASAFLSFAVFGLFASLAPGFVAGILHHPNRLLAGTVAFIAFGAAVAAQSLTGRLAPRRRLAVALFGQALGLVVVAAGVVGTDFTVFLVGGALAGAGAGMLFKSGMGTVVGMAAAGARGEALAGLFLIAYLGLIIPAIGVGLATRYVSVQTAMLWFTGLLLGMLVTVTVLERVAHRGHA
jgi:MFS family permease